MALRDILTQNDLLILNEALQQVASNLKIHVNDSLSHTHGLNAVVANYYDSSGDKWGNMVVVFEFGIPPDITFIYVPAQVTVLGPASTGSGLVTDGANSGAFSSPGVPLVDKPLVTELTTDAVNQALIHDNLLLAHANTVHSDSGANQCHGGTAYTSTSTTDSLGHLVGRKYVTIGINGTAWKILGDEFVDGTSYGPPQTIRGVNMFSNIALRHNVAAMGRDDNQYCSLWLTAATGGTTPYTVEWQINASADGSSATWNAMITNQASGIAGYHTATTAKNVEYDVSAVSNDKLVLHAQEGSDNRRLQCTVRAKITNQSGVVYTNYCRFYANDEDGCGFISDPDVNSNTWYEAITGSPGFQP